METMLVPLDGSEHSQTAVQYAADLARALGTRLPSMRVVNDVGGCVGNADGAQPATEEQKYPQTLQDYASEQVVPLGVDMAWELRGVSGLVNDVEMYLHQGAPADLTTTVGAIIGMPPEATKKATQDHGHEH